MQKNYDTVLSLLLQHEGGYDNHPSDPGGPTNFGITIYDYRKYVKPDATADDVRRMQLSEAKEIYATKYWRAQNCDQLEGGVDYAIFDYGVNSGVGRSGKVLRRCLGLPDNSSLVTPEVIAAAQAMPAAQLVAAICDERLRFLKALRTWPVFGKGWGRRVAEVKAFGQKIAEDIPIDPSAVQAIAAAPGRAVDGAESARIRRLQKLLNDGGFDAGAEDGDLGPKTVKAFQRSKGLLVDGVVGPQTRPLLAAALAAAAGAA